MATMESAGRTVNIKLEEGVIFMLLKIWNYERHKYEKYRVPNEWNVKIYADNMEEIINCAHCGKKIKAGDSYTSYEIHNEVGIGYGVCEKCFNIEMLRKNKYKGE